MALPKDRTLHDSRSMGSKVQTCVFNDITTAMEITSLSSFHGVKNHNLKSLFEDQDGSNSALTTHHSPPLYGTGIGYTNYQIQEAESVINFKDNNLMQPSESLLSFQHSKFMHDNNSYLKDNIENEYHCSVWENNFHNQISPRNNEDLRLVQDFNCFETATCYSSIINTVKEKQNGESSFGWVQEPGEQEQVMKKRPSMGENMKAAKKQCTTESKTPKPKSSPSNDPQSVAAKNRRERISERMKILQDLVPNGSKVDLVTMLEKAISYVKFLQVQVKVLATDEFWPVQGGKAPDISQVKEAIDAILSTQREGSSTSK